MQSLKRRLDRYRDKQTRKLRANQFKEGYGWIWAEYMLSKRSLKELAEYIFATQHAASRAYSRGCRTALRDIRIRGVEA